MVNGYFKLEASTIELMFILVAGAALFLLLFFGIERGLRKLTS